MSEEQRPPSDAVQGDNHPEEPVYEPEPEPMEPIPVGGDTSQPSPAPEETEEEKELRELRESADHNRLVLSPEQARRWQHELRLPDAAMPANDHESERE